MYYQECERLATEQTSLRPLIADIDQKLHSLGPSAVLRADEFAAIIKQPADKVAGVFQELTRLGLLREERHAECPLCGTLNDLAEYRKAVSDGDGFECSACDRDIARRNAKEVVVHRLNAHAVEQVKRQNGGAPSTTIPLERPALVEELPQRIIDDPFRYTPLMHYYSQDAVLVKAWPLAGRRVVFVLHFLLDLVPFVEACKRLGLEMQNAYFFYKEYPYPQREGIAALLRQRGATVQPRGQMGAWLKQLADGPKERVGELLFVEDGGFLVPSVHGQFKFLLPSVRGAVEQTSRGAWNDDEVVGGLRVPVLSVAQCKLKNSFEPPYIAEASVSNIKRMLPNLNLRGLPSAVFGYGAISGTIADWLRTSGSIVTVYDKDPKARLAATQHGHMTADSPVDAVRGKGLVVGASGNRSIDSTVIAALSHNTYVVSASSEQYEIDVEELEQQQKRRVPLVDDTGRPVGTSYSLPSGNRTIHLVANGYPVNFWGSESMPEQAADLIMSLILLSLVEVAQGSYAKPGLDSDAVNEIADKYKLAEKFLEFHNAR